MDPPAHRVIRAFGARGTPRPIPGGQGTSWRVGNIVLKPLGGVSASELEWQARVLGSLNIDHVRLVLPLQSVEGNFAVDGWAATPFVDGVHEPGRWLDIIEVGRRLAPALSNLARPAFLDGRKSPWATADAIAWDEQPVDGFLVQPHIEALVALRRPIAASAQLIHGDLTGNVLFSKDLAPAVIDFSAYWRPAAYASAMVVADALIWEDAPGSLVTALDEGADTGQYLVRALLFRAVVEVLRRPSEDQGVLAGPFRRALEIARQLEAR